MRFAAPLGLAAAALAVPLLAWYVLRSRRPRRVVASTFLWQQAQRTVAAAIPWQRFRGDATFWLVLLALLLGALALARPFVPVPAELGDHTILIVDASGSMLASEEGPSRSELARRAAQDLVDRLAPGQEVSVVEAGARGRVLISATDDPAAASRALAAVRHTHGPADWADAFTLAAALERPGQDTVVHLLTDGVLPESAAATAPGGLRVTAVGKDRPNLAVTRVQATPTGAGQSEVLVQVRNLGLLPTKGRVTLTVDGTDVLEEAVDLGPRGTRDLVLTVNGGEDSLLVARVAPTGTDVTGADNADALAVDDAGFAVLSSAQTTNVVLATPGNVFLAAALAATEGVELTVIDTVPAATATGPDAEALAEADLLVVDRLPVPDAPTIPTLYVSPTTLPAGITDDGIVDLPALTFQAPDHPILAEVDLAETAIATGRVLTAPALTTIASAPGVPLVQAGRLDRVPVVLVGFDLLESNLPLQAAFPVLVSNTVTWLTGPPAPAAAAAGQNVTLSPPVGTAEVRITPPSGDPFVVDASRPTALLDQVGLWRATWVGTAANGTTGDLGTRVIAVNAAVEEADLSRPRPDSVASGDRGQAGSGGSSAPDPGTRDADEPVAAEGRQPFGPTILIAVFALAVLEWLVAHRRRGRRDNGGMLRSRRTADDPLRAGGQGAKRTASETPPGGSEKNAPGSKRARGTQRGGDDAAREAVSRDQDRAGTS